MAGRSGGNNVPPEVLRYLLPQERHVIVVRRHPVVMAGPAGFLASAGIAAGLLTATRRKDVTAARGAWVASALALPVSAIRVHAWLNSYFVVTNARLLYVKSVTGIKVKAVSLRDIRGIELRRSLLGRLFGYGTFVIKSSGSDEKISFLPYPELLYLEVYDILHPAAEED